MGDRCTELLLPDATFEALRDLFASNDFDRIRPYRPGQVSTYDFVRQARAQGPSIVQAFHERATSKTSRTRPILKDVAAFANTSGGTIQTMPAMQIMVSAILAGDESKLARNQPIMPVLATGAGNSSAGASRR